MRSISELNPHGLLTPCVRFAPASHPTNGNTRYRPARYGFDRTGLAPAGFQQEVSLTHRSSSSSALFPARSQYDPLPSAAVLRTGHRNRLKRPLKLRQRATLPSQIGCPKKQRAGIAPAEVDEDVAQIGSEASQTTTRDRPIPNPSSRSHRAHFAKRDDAAA